MRIQLRRRCISVVCGYWCADLPRSGASPMRTAPSGRGEAGVGKGTGQGQGTGAVVSGMVSHVW